MNKSSTFTIVAIPNGRVDNLQGEHSTIGEFVLHKMLWRAYRSWSTRNVGHHAVIAATQHCTARQSQTAKDPWNDPRVM